MNNPLDRKPFKNKLAGKGVSTKQHFKPHSNLSGYGKGSEVTVDKNALAMPVVRTGSSTGRLVKRTYTDAAPGVQGGLREATDLISRITKFCKAESTNQRHIIGMNYQETLDRLEILRSEQAKLSQSLVDFWAQDEKNRNRPKRQKLSSDLIMFCGNPMGFSMTIDNIRKELF